MNRASTLQSPNSGPNAPALKADHSAREPCSASGTMNGSSITEVRGNAPSSKVPAPI